MIYQVLLTAVFSNNLTINLSINFITSLNFPFPSFIAQICNIYEHSRPN